MKVTIDRKECTSCALCWDSCPDVFEENPEDGFSQIVAQYRANGSNAEGDVPEEQRECVEDSAAGCPVDIIHVE